MRYKLGEVCDTISNTYRGNASSVVLINTSDVLDGKVLNHEPVDNCSLKGQFKKTFQMGDILYSEIRPKNKRFAYVDFTPADYIASTKLMVIRARPNLIIPMFLYQVLKSDAIIDELQGLAETRSGTFPQITFSELANLEIELPPLGDQYAIADVILAFDNRIENNTRINHHLEQVAQAVFKSWFVDFEPFNEGKFIESKLGKIPASWYVGTLSELMTVKYGKDHKKIADGTIPVFGSGGIMRFVDTALYNGESVLIPRKGTLNNVIYVNQPFWSVDTMFFTEMNRPNLAKYIYFFLRFKDLASMNAGSAVPSMTTEILNALQVVIPPDKELARFENIVGIPFQLIRKNQDENDSLATLRDTLLPRLMSGELSVADIDNVK
jgi:type I restriction enzyme S subunit